MGWSDFTDSLGDAVTGAIDGAGDALGDYVQGKVADELGDSETALPDTHPTPAVGSDGEGGTTATVPVTAQAPQADKWRRIAFIVGGVSAGLLLVGVTLKLAGKK